MSRLSDFAASFGFGTDPEGDRRRREELPGEILRINGEEFARLRDAGARGWLSRPEFRRAIAAEADRIVREAKALGVDPVEDPDPVPGHLLSKERTSAGNTVARCECGRWDGGWTGPRSRRRVLDDYAAHVAAELAAAGPIRVTAERLDQPRAIDPPEEEP